MSLTESLTSDLTDDLTGSLTGEAEADNVIIVGFQFSKSGNTHGFDPGIPIGSITPNTIIWQDTSLEVTITKLAWFSGNNLLTLTVTGASGADDDWVSFNLDGADFVRTAATTYSAPSTWQFTVGSNPFGLEGETSLLNWTI